MPLPGAGWLALGSSAAELATAKMAKEAKIALTIAKDFRNGLVNMELEDESNFWLFDMWAKTSTYAPSAGLHRRHLAVTVLRQPIISRQWF